MTDYSIWPATNGPAADGNDPSDISRGVIFRLSAPGWLKKIRFYRGTLDVTNPTTGAAEGRVYTVAGEAPVAGTDVEFTLSGTGWQDADVVPAVPLAANTTYKAAVLTGDYTPTGGYFSTGPGVGGIVSGIITAPDAAGVPSGIGSIQQGSFKQPTVGLEYPTQYFNGGNYWVDVVIADEDPGLDVRDVTGTATISTAPAVDSDKVTAFAVTSTMQSGGAVDDIKVGDSATTLTMVASASVVSEAVGPGVAAPVSDVLCSSWANFVDVPQAVRDELTTTEAEWTVLLLRASELLWAFSGRRWYGGGCSETAVLRSWPSEVATGTWPYHDSWGRCGCWVYGDGGLPSVPWELLPFGFRHIQAPMAIKLPRKFITGIVSVTIDGDPFTDYRLLRTGWLERLDNQGWNTCGGDTTVTYLWGEPPPLGGKEAAIALATELARAATGIGECRLPSNVVSITRQGLTIEKLSINDFLDKYRTGVPEVDMWLSAVNPRGHQRSARIWSPDIPAAVRSPQ
jgi:hypothetical protein